MSTTPTPHQLDSSIDIEALRKAAEAATRGPWEAAEPSDDLHHYHWSVRCPSNPPAISHELCRLSSVNSNEDNDARYIAAFDPPTILALLDRLERAEADVPNGYKLVMVPNGPAPDAPDYNEAKRQADMATGVEGPDSAWLSIFIREINRWCHHRAEAAAGAVPEEARAVIEEAAQVLESAAAHNRKQGRTVTEHTQQDRANRLRAIIAAPPAQGLPAAPVAAGHFKRDGSGAWHEVPRQQSTGATILYHANGWPNAAPAAAPSEPVAWHPALKAADHAKLEDGELAAFEAWWEEHGQFCRAGGGDYEKTFAYRAWQARGQQAGDGEPVSVERIAELVEESRKLPNLATTTFTLTPIQIAFVAGKLATPPAQDAGTGDAWISVDDERKPDLNQQIILFVRTVKYGESDDGQPIEHHDAEVAMGEYRKYGDLEPQFDCYTSPMSDSDWITHWMPNPAPPIDRAIANSGRTE